ncbi:hypothetical protein GQ53DRAFT_797327 [Thozetella sp. PMI_491]|nr:hypothetical protein GQ53DRAFT_797327 [Thozetella sp. PMI_491]
MPIGDLLASITGESPKASPVASKSGSPAPKRKAEDDLRGPVKRSNPPATNSSRFNGDSPRPSPRLPDLPNGRTSVPSKPVTGTSSASDRRPLATSARGPSSAGLSKPASSRPPISRPAVKSGPPKKGSFQEIMARAQAAQEARASFGKIQHKTIERSLTMKERKEMKTQETRGARKAPAQTPQKPNRGAPQHGSSAARTAGNENRMSGLSKPAGLGKGKKSPPADSEVKKLKKAATATTGYTGTARPRPQAASKSGSAGRPSGESKEKSRPRYPAALSNPRRRYDDYDEDLDDFIEYDDEEDEPGYGRRGGYDSLEDDESDMEAGMSDIDQEERRADLQARREDQEQEKLEKRLKREKEERKRQYLKGGGR